MFKKLLFLAIILTALLAAATPAQADWASTAKNKLETATQGLDFASDIETTTGSVLNAALALVGTIFLVLTIYAGILWMTSSGNEDQAGKAKKIITASVIGLIIVMSAYAITMFVTGKLGAGGGGGGGNGELTSPTERQICARLGGLCVNPPRGGGSISCSYFATGGRQMLTGTVLDGNCGYVSGGTSNSVCCELREDAPDSRGNNIGTFKCGQMGGRCVRATCPSSDVDVGDCDEPGPDLTNNCCRSGS